MKDQHTPTVIVDGIEYIPAKKAIANELAIKKGLLYQFWGYCDDEKVDERCEYLVVDVTDSPRENGLPTIDDIIVDIAKFSK